MDQERGCVLKIEGPEIHTRWIVLEYQNEYIVRFLRDSYPQKNGTCFEKHFIVTSGPGIFSGVKSLA